MLIFMHLHSYKAVVGTMYRHKGRGPFSSHYIAHRVSRCASAALLREISRPYWDSGHVRLAQTHSGLLTMMMLEAILY